jgi:LysR family transcriptional regulator, hca operon transcriptional activator
VVDQNAVLDAENVCGNPIHRSTETAKSPVHDHAVSLSHDRSGFAADHLAMRMSLIASTGGLGLLPAYAQNFIPSSVTSRPLKGDTPTVDLVLGYKKSNKSPILKLLLSRLDELVARVSKKAH